MLSSAAGATNASRSDNSGSGQWDDCSLDMATADVGDRSNAVSTLPSDDRKEERLSACSSLGESVKYDCSDHNGRYKPVIDQPRCHCLYAVCGLCD